MPIDIQRILESAAKAAVEQAAQAAPGSRAPKKRRLSTGRAMLLGAGLATAGRLVVSRKGRDMLRRAQRQITDSKWLEEREPADAEDPEDYEDDEPEDLGDEELLPEDEEIDDSPDLDEEPGADPDEDEDETEQEDPNADDDRSRDAEPKRPPRRRTRQRGRA